MHFHSFKEEAITEFKGMLIDVNVAVASSRCSLLKPSTLTMSQTRDFSSDPQNPSSRNKHPKTSNTDHLNNYVNFAKDIKRKNKCPKQGMGFYFIL